MMKTLSLHMQANNGVSTNMGIVYVAPVQNKSGIHFMVNLSDHEVQCHNNMYEFYKLVNFITCNCESSAPFCNL